MSVKSSLKKLTGMDSVERIRHEWLKRVLSDIPKGSRLLDAGAGELRNKGICEHLDYVSQDFCQYEGVGDDGLHQGDWDTSKIDIVCDITCIPEADGAFDVILCSEVLEHVPDPLLALDEFCRLLKPGGILILTAPFASLVHFAPYHYCTGFSRYWYEYHLPVRGFHIMELSANGDWFSFCKLQILRLGKMARKYSDWAWPLAYLLGGIALVYFFIRRGDSADDLGCFGWNCLAKKER